MSGAVAAVLCYHRIANVSRDRYALAVSPEAFRSQLAQLREEWQVVPLQVLTAASASGEPLERSIALTFDDGYLDNLEVAAPIVAEFGMPATFFLTSEPHELRRRFWWDVLEEALFCSDPRPEVIELRLGGERRRAVRAEGEGRLDHDGERRLGRAPGEHADRERTEASDPQRPGVEDVLDGICAGVRSAATYVGARTVAELAERATVGIQTMAGFTEGTPHGL